MDTTYGTEDQRRLQAVSDTWAETAADTPGAAIVGRMRGTDDPEALGWNVIADALAEDGAFGFRMIPVEQLDRIRDRLDTFGARLDTWLVYRGDRNTIADPSALSWPDGISEVPVSDPLEEATRAFQAAMETSGVVPFSGQMLTGQFGPVTNAALARGGEIVATAHAYKPHVGDSPWHGLAWAGLISVAKSERGHGLGRFVNALIASKAIALPGVSEVYQLVTKTNVVSQRMVEASGLSLDPEHVCGFAVRGGGRFTQ